MTPPYSPTFLPRLSKLFIGLYLLLLLIVAAYIRIDGANEYHYHQDEAMHVGVSQGKNLTEVLNFSLNEAHPPLLYILLHYWLMISNDSAFVRGFSLLLGLCTIPLYYAIGKKLNGELTGLLAATLVTFSFGLIIQSYVVRHYSLLVFLLSACFYCYLYWHENRSKISLIGYLIFGLLACLTHFSAVFTIFTMAVVETLQLINKKAVWQQQLGWIITNLFLGMVAAATVYMCLPLLNDFHHLYVEHSYGKILSLAYAFIYLIPIIAYVSPCPEWLLLWVLLLFIAIGRLYYKSRNFSLIVILALTVEILGMATQAYPFDAHTIRHDIWLAPFVIIPLAWLLADITIFCARKTAMHNSGLYIVTGVFFITGVLMYNPQLRFSDLSEYALRENEWGSLKKYLNSLDNTHLVITARSDVALLATSNNNPYKMMNANAVKERASGILPLAQAKMLFPEFYFHFDGDTFLRMMNNAKNDGTLDNIDTLVFVRIRPSQNSAFHLLYCDTLDKKLIFIPPLNTNAPATKEDILTNSIVLLEIPKNIFFDEMAAENGKAHSCLADSNN